MCTVSWHAADGAFTVLFNRDEHRQRQAALPPAAHDINGIPALYPVDPEGGGTWLGVNTFGVVLCVLNYYDRENPGSAPLTEEFTSRGQLLVQLLSARCVDEISDQLVGENLNAYRPFHFLLLSPREQNQWTWSGAGLTSRHFQVEDNPLTTSSLSPEDVIDWRRNRYRKTVHSIDDARRYHYHQEAGAVEFSVRMERESTQTVSISEISIDSSGIRFTYDDLVSAPSHSTLELDADVSGDFS